MYRVGADEAGKGPVLGPMVAAAVRADPDRLPAGIDDSKRLTPSRRGELASALSDDPEVGLGVAVVGTDRIDAAGSDMNSLTVAAQAEAIGAVAGDGDAAVVDAGDVDAERFARRVEEAVREGGVSTTVDAEHGADETYQLVGAASVVAKVERDARVAALAEEYGDVGSGYPGDPRTREFLRRYVDEHGELPACARASWQTCDDLLAAAAQSSLSEF